MKYGKWIIGLAAVGALTVGAVLRKRHKKEKGALLSANNKLSDNYQLLNHWLEVKNEGKSLAGYFLEMGYSRIAIYGMAELANRLTEDLAGSGVEIVYGIDRDAGCSISRIAEVYSPQEDSLPEVDAVIVTPYYALEAIKKDLSGKVACPVVSIEEVVWSV
jgi:hypothetical protein|nr:hypothetical protein [uncultured Acetatifactor sp.]